MAEGAARSDNSVVMGRHTVLIGLVLGFLSVVTTDAQEPRLVLGDEVQRVVDGGETVGYRLELSDGDFLRATVLQDGIDVVARLRRDDGTVVVEMDSPNGTSGPEPLAVVVSSAGEYRLEAESLDPRAAAGRVQITIDARQPAGPAEHAWADAEAAMAKAAILAWRGRAETLAEAVEVYTTAIEAWRRAARPADVARALLALGNVHRRIGGHAAAREALSSALEIHRASGDMAGIAAAQNALCLVDHATGALDAARVRCREAAESYAQLGDDAGAARALNNLGLVHHGAGALDEAAEAYARALPLLVAVGDEGTAAVTRHNLAGVHHLRGDDPTALELYGEALAVFERSGAGQRAAETLNNLGQTYRYLGEPQAALDHFERAARAFVALGDLRRTTEIRVNQAALWRFLGRPERCVALLEPRVPATRERGEPKGLADVMQILGRCREDAGDGDGADDAYREALALRRAIGDRVGEASTLRAIGARSLDAGALDEGLAQLGEALSIARSLGRVPIEQRLASQIAEGHRRAGNREAAWHHAMASLELARSSAGPEGLFQARALLMRLAHEDARVQDARTHGEAAMTTIEGLRSELIGPARRADFFATVRAFFEDYLDVLVSSATDEPDGPWVAEAFRVAEHARARSLLDRVGEGDRVLDDDPAAAAHRERLRRALEGRADARRAALAADDDDRAAALDRTIRDIVNRLDALDVAARRGSSRLSRPPIIDLETVRTQLLGPREAMLAYLVGSRASVAWLVTRSRAEVYTLPGHDSLASLSQSVFAGWSLLDLTAEGAATAAATAATALAEAILPSTLQALDAERLLVVPDGTLAQVPFAALPFGDGVVIDRFAVATLSSASVLAALRARTGAPRSGRTLLAVLADPVFEGADPRLGDSPPDHRTSSSRRSEPWSRLPATAREAASIGRIAAAFGDVSTATGLAANRSRLAAEAPRARILHLATHAVLDDRDPALSGVVLSQVDDQGQEIGGFVRLHEIYDLPIAADLVVLSACATAAGRALRGEGRIGLTRGFLAAGARAVLATSWPIDDRAGAVMMEAFYEALLEQRATPVEALRRAQNIMRRRGRFRHPSYWAGYVLHGDGLSPIVGDP